MNREQHLGGIVKTHRAKSSSQLPSFQYRVHHLNRPSGSNEIEPTLALGDKLLLSLCENSPFERVLVGKGVQQAVENVNEVIAPEVEGVDAAARAEGRQIVFRCGAGVLLLFNAEATRQAPPPDAKLPVPPHGAAGPGGHSWGAFGMANPAHALGRAITHFVTAADAITREAGVSAVLPTEQADWFAQFAAAPREIVPARAAIQPISVEQPSVAHTIVAAERMCGLASRAPQRNTGLAARSSRPSAPSSRSRPAATRISSLPAGDASARRMAEVGPLARVARVADVIVIGGGLAGTSTAIHLARAGRKVLLFEKQRYPAHKLCGEFLSVEVAGLFDRLGVLEAVRAAGACTIETARVTTTGGASFEAPLPGRALGLSRYRLDHLLLGHARTAGVDARDGTPVRDVRGDLGAGFRVETDGAVFAAPLVVGAYGKRGTLDRPRRRASAPSWDRTPQFGSARSAIRSGPILRASWIRRPRRIRRRS